MKPWMWKTLLFVWVCVILFLSFYSSPKVNEIQPFPHFDKVVHFLMYSVLVLLVYLSGVVSGIRSGDYWLLVVVLLMGAAIELLQGILTVNRTPSFYDLLFNMIGVVCAMGIYRTFRK